MGFELTGNVEVLRIIELLTKVLAEGDLANYYVAIDNENDEDTKNVSLADLFALAGDINVKVSANDNVSNYLYSKLVAGTNITLTINNPGANETITIDATGGGGASEWEIITNILSNVTKTVDYVSVFADSIEVARFGDGADPKFLIDPTGIRGGGTGIVLGGGTFQIYESSSGQILFKSGATFPLSVNTDGIGVGNAKIRRLTPTATVPNIVINTVDNATGLGWAGSGKMSLIVGGVSGLKIELASGTVQYKYAWTTGIVASTTQTQGQQLLAASRNEISTVANTNDVVTMPQAVVGLEVLIVNNGANTLQIFPSVSDDLGGGVDVSVTLVAGAVIVFEAYNSINWITK